jgi:hypothetical protein
VFNLDGLSDIRKVKWKDLRAGSIVLVGAKINDSMIPELTGFPVLTDDLLNELFTTYKFLANREVVVADALYNFSPFEVAKDLRKNEETRNRFNRLRTDNMNHKKMILVDLGLDPNTEIPIIETENVEQEYLIRDNYNSFSYLYGLSQDLTVIPSLFHRLDLELSLGDLLSDRLNSKFNLPDDKEVLLHLVVDFSRSMDSAGKLDLVISALNSFHDHIVGILPHTRINLYVFSDTCQPASYPLNGHEINRGETDYSTFMKKVLHFRDKNVHNKIILFTDGQATDRLETLKMAELIKKNQIDYTQLIFDIKDEQRHEVVFPDGQPGSGVVDNVVSEVDDNMVQVELTDEALDRKMKGIYHEFTEIAEACGGNQVIIRINELIRIVSVECYDRYMGLLTLATRKETEAIRNETYDGTQSRVKKWDFKRL